MTRALQLVILQTAATIATSYVMVEVGAANIVATVLVGIVGVVTIFATLINGGGHR